MDDENYQFAIDIAETDDKKYKVPTDEIMEKVYKVKIISRKLSRSEYPSISEVPAYLRPVNGKNGYQPQIIAIGPYHKYNPDKTEFKNMEEHKKRWLEMMEERKLLSLKMLLRRHEGHSMESYMRVMLKLEKSARKCYVDANRNEGFVQMMLLDACFIVELFRYCFKKANRKEPLFNSRWMEQKLRLDLLLPDNQIPFFVLEEFFKMTKTPDENERKDERNHFLTMIFNFFASVLHNQSYEQDAEEAGCSMVPTTGSYPFFHSERFHAPNAIEHLLSLVYYGLVDQVAQYNLSTNSSTRNCKWKIFSFLKTKEKKGARNCNWKIFSFLKTREKSGTRNCNWKIFWFLKTKEKNGFRRRCATKLKEAGIKFKEAKGKGLLDIKFEHGIMKIPRLKIDDGTESFFQNLIFYEQWCTEESDHPVIDYVNFMDILINSEKDVELLCQQDILDNCLGDDQVVAKMFNNLGDLVTFSPGNIYSKIYTKVDKYCDKRRNQWMAKLKHNYCNSPWTIASVIAALLLLSLTVGQTLYSVLAYYK